MPQSRACTLTTLLLAVAATALSMYRARRTERLRPSHGQRFFPFSVTSVELAGPQPSYFANACAMIIGRKVMITFTMLVAALYFIATFPVVLLLIQSEYFRFITLETISRKWSYIARPHYAFCGDSLTASGENWAIRFGELPTHAINLAVAGYTVAQVTSEIPAARHYGARKLFLLAGTNDFLNGHSNAAILRDYSAMLSCSLQNGFSNVVCTSIPVQANPVNDARILALDDEIKKIVEGMGNRYVDLNTEVRKYPNRATLFEPDGIHLSEAGYRVWSAQLKLVRATPL